jgi:hypothetical protein
MRRELPSLAFLLVIAVVGVLIIVAAVREDPKPKPQIGKAVCVQTTVRPDGSVHTETCVP